MSEGPGVEPAGSRRVEWVLGYRSAAGRGIRYALPAIAAAAALVLVMLPVLTLPTRGANVTWTGGGATTNWNLGANWSTGTPPTATDVAVFDGTSSKVVLVNANINVGGIQVTAAYGGSITQGAGRTITIGTSGWDQAGSSFAGSAAAITVNGPFALGGGTFTSTSGILSVAGDLTHGAGTFAHNSGTLRLIGAAAALNLPGTLSRLEPGPGPQQWHGEDPRSGRHARRGRHRHADQRDLGGRGDPSPRPDRGHVRLRRWRRHAAHRRQHRPARDRHGHGQRRRAAQRGHRQAGRHVEPVRHDPGRQRWLDLPRRRARSRHQHRVVRLGQPDRRQSRPGQRGAARQRCQDAARRRDVDRGRAADPDRRHLGRWHAARRRRHRPGFGLRRRQWPPAHRRQRQSALHRQRQLDHRTAAGGGHRQAGRHAEPGGHDPHPARLDLPRRCAQRRGQHAGVRWGADHQRQPCARRRRVPRRERQDDRQSAPRSWSPSS